MLIFSTITMAGNESTTVTVAPQVLSISKPGYGTSGSTDAANNWSPREELPANPERVAALEKNLWWWNFWCGLFHLVQAIAALVLGE